MEEVIPLSHFSLFQWYEIETLVCGNPDVDVEVLRKHTTYRAGLTVNHPVSRNLFKALTSFSSEERRLFLRFVWGRNRLPLQHGDWVQPFAIGLASPPNGGACGPVGDGCGRSGLGCVNRIDELRVPGVQQTRRFSGAIVFTTVQVFLCFRAGDPDGMLPVSHTVSCDF